jgi:hypothetical protein
MARILAVDPGSEQSAWVWYFAADAWAPEHIKDFGKVPNEELRHLIHINRNLGQQSWDHLAIEMVACYGMPVGREVFETALWVGRFIEAWGGPYTLIYRKDVKMHLCHSMRANDGNVAQALRDRLGPKGTKKAPGPCFGISKDVWQALAVAVTYADSLKPKAAV